MSDKKDLIDHRQYLAEEDQALLAKHDEDELYGDVYVDYKMVGGQWRQVAVHCMRCGVLILDFQDLETRKLLKNNQVPDTYRPVRRNLDDGSYLNLLLCPKCEHLEIDEDRILAVIKSAWARESELAGKTQDEIKVRADKFKPLRFEKEEK